MDSQITANVSGAIISGVLSIIAALVPKYVESRKTPEERREEVRTIHFRFHPGWRFTGAVAALIFVYSVMGALFLGSLGLGMLISAMQTDDPQAFISELDWAKSLPIFRTAAFYIFDCAVTLLFAPFVFFGAKDSAHRFGPKRFYRAVLIVPCFEIYLLLLYYAFRNSPTALPVRDFLIAEALRITVLSFVAVLGCRLAARTHTTFLIHYALQRMPISEQVAVLDLLSQTSTPK